MPEEAGLGTHLTLMLDGGAKFGPDSEWVAWDPEEGPDYAVDPARGDKFYAGVILVRHPVQLQLLLCTACFWCADGHAQTLPAPETRIAKDKSKRLLGR